MAEADAVLMMMYGSLSALVGAYFGFSGGAIKKWGQCHYIEKGALTPQYPCVIDRESLRITSAIIILIRTYAYAPWVSLLSPVVLAVGSNHSLWRSLVLTDATLIQQSKITKSAERSQHDWTNTIQRDWTGYVVAGQQGAAKTSRNWNQKEAAHRWNWLGTGSNSFGSK